MQTIEYVKSLDTDSDSINRFDPSTGPHNQILRSMTNADD